MKSSTAQIASLTAFGNANLLGYQEIFDIQHSSSLHCQLIEFIEIPSNGSLKERKIIATDPNA